MARPRLALTIVCHPKCGLVATTCAQINDRYEFYEELDLDIGDGKYLSPDADRSKRNKYRLHSVLVHSGGHARRALLRVQPPRRRQLAQVRG